MKRVPPTVSRTLLDDATRDRVLALARLLENEDGAPPLSDQTLARLRSPDVDHLIVRTGDEVIGYGQLDGDALEIAATVAAANVLLDDASPRRVWSHGRRSRLLPLLESRGLERTRELHQLRRELDGTLEADPPLPAGVRVRSFSPGRDDSAWLALNSAAFAHHPEQGALKQSDLDALMAQDWFDANGFLLAERDDGTLVAFHWTKMHADGRGEVYVLGVAPDAQGLGLGGAMLTRGLRYLRGLGCEDVLLYVDGDNPAALHLYERAGFTRHDLDIQWSAT